MLHPHEESMRDAVACVASLQIAVDRAGGAYMVLDLETMTAMELILLIAPNKIRFVYQPQEKK